MVRLRGRYWLGVESLVRVTVEVRCAIYMIGDISADPTRQVFSYAMVSSRYMGGPGQPPMSTVPVAMMVPMGSGAGSLQVSTLSPLRAAGLPPISTVALPSRI